MNIMPCVIATCLASLSLLTLAAVSEEEASQLNGNLTLFGAIQAGNKEGTIPPYTGGLVDAPANFKPDSGHWINPYANERPILKITAENLDEYADKLSEGQKHLLKNRPGYYMNIYPSHRSAAYPDNVLAATRRNATECNTEKDHLAVNESCRGGFPFPIPKNGYQAMWNQTLGYYGPTAITATHNRSWMIDRSGGRTMTADQATFTERPFYQTELKDRNPQMSWRTYSVTQTPARKAGEITGISDFLDTVDKPRRSWSYMPGQRRVKLAPEFAYDTPIATLGGGLLFDELYLFSGKMDRFDFKLTGKREMYIPYNNYDLYTPTQKCNSESQFTDSFINPECERYELHRVWVVEATLKPNQRHVYSKRVYYLDEDLSGAGMFDAYDHSGSLYRALFNTMIQMYDHSIPWAVRSTVYDFNKGSYTVLGDAYVGGFRVTSSALTERNLKPETITAQNTQR